MCLCSLYEGPNHLFFKCVKRVCIRRRETWNRRKASFISKFEAPPSGSLTRQGLFGLLKGASQVVNIVYRACWKASFPWKHCDHELFQTFWFISVQDSCLFQLLTRFVSRAETEFARHVLDVLSALAVLIIASLWKSFSVLWCHYISWCNNLGTT